MHVDDDHQIHGDTIHHALYTASQSARLRGLDSIVRCDGIMLFD